MSEREEFERWCNVYGCSVQPEWKHFGYMSWQEATARQQKKIDALKALNPDVPCPMCGGEGTLPLDCSSEYDENFCDCGYCKSSGTVPLTKAQEYRIKQLEATINCMIEEAR